MILNNFRHNLFIFLPFDILCILKFIQYLYAFFIRTSIILMRLNDVFCKGLQPENVFFIAHETLVPINGKNY